MYPIGGGKNQVLFSNRISLKEFFWGLSSSISIKETPFGVAASSGGIRVGGGGELGGGGRGL